MSKIEWERDLVRKMRVTPGLLGYKIVVVTDRTDLEGQLRETARLSGETLRPNELDERFRESPTARTQRILREPTPDICFAMLQKYQDGARDRNGERVSMTIQRKEKRPGKDQPVIEKTVTYTDRIDFENFPLLNESPEILVLVDEAHRGNTRTLHRNLRRALPNAAIVGFAGTPILSRDKKTTAEIFGDFIDPLECLMHRVALVEPGPQQQQQVRRVIQQRQACVMGSGIAENTE